MGRTTLTLSPLPAPSSHRTGPFPPVVRRCHRTVRAVPAQAAPAGTGHQAGQTQRGCDGLSLPPAGAAQEEPLHLARDAVRGRRCGRGGRSGRGEQYSPAQGVVRVQGAAVLVRVGDLTSDAHAAGAKAHAAARRAAALSSAVPAHTHHSPHTEAPPYVARVHALHLTHKHTSPLVVRWAIARRSLTSLAHLTPSPHSFTSLPHLTRSPHSLTSLPHLTPSPHSLTHPHSHTHTYTTHAHALTHTHLLTLHDHTLRHAHTRNPPTPPHLQVGGVKVGADGTFEMANVPMEMRK
eukprot:scaffold27718_cov107-Isochrysis_galbana.AAC.1